MFQAFGPDEEQVPDEQQLQQAERRAAFLSGTEHLPLLDARQTALSSALHHRVSALLLVGFYQNLSNNLFILKWFMFLIVFCTYCFILTSLSMSCVCRAPRFWSSQYVQDVPSCVDLWAGGSYCRPRSSVQGCHGFSPQDHPHFSVLQPTTQVGDVITEASF